MFQWFDDMLLESTTFVNTLLTFEITRIVVIKEAIMNSNIMSFSLFCWKRFSLPLGSVLPFKRIDLTRNMVILLQ